MSDVERSLLRLFRVMAQIGLPIAAHLNPGLPQQEIQERCQQAGVNPPSDLVDLYRLCDGMKPDWVYSPQRGEYGLVGISQLMTLDEALREHERVKEDALYSDEFDAAWFPFLGEGGDYYLVDLKAYETEEPSIIWKLREFWPIRIYSSLPTMFDTLADAYEAGAYGYIAGLPHLGHNLQESLIARQRNPNVAYWQERIQELSGSASD